MSYDAPQYSGAPGYGAAPVPARPGKGVAIASLVLGILALLTGWIVVGSLFGIAAIVLGILGLRNARRGADGRVMSIIGIVLGVLGILSTALVIAAGVAFFNSDDAKDLRDCRRAAGDDQAAISKCEDQFKENVKN